MNRHYTVEQYLELIEYARKTVPGITFSSDIIVGFPGETEADFVKTLELVQKVGYMPVSYTHLDVYKRQVEEQQLHHRSPSGRPDLRQAEGTGKVSYTAIQSTKII